MKLKTRFTAPVALILENTVGINWQVGKLTRLSRDREQSFCARRRMGPWESMTAPSASELAEQL